MKRKTVLLLLLASLMAVIAIWSCGTQRKLETVRKDNMQAKIQLAKDRGYTPDVKVAAARRDTLKVMDDDGKEMLIMKAVKDETTGDMVANEELDAAVVTARFRNLAERHGKVDLEFQVIVPFEMQDEKWQLRFHPDMFILGDSTRLDDVVITGAMYRKAQMRGYQMYNKFLERLMRDKSHVTDLRNLEIWLSRNIPEVYKYRNDTTFVSEEEFYSFFGTSEQEAVDHYTRFGKKRRVEERWNNRDKIWARLVKDPIITQGVRLDTVMITPDGDFVYNYVQTIRTRKGLRKVDIVLSGDISEQGRKLYDMPPSEPLTFYISSVAAFADHTEKYMDKIVSRRATANAKANIVFKENKWDIDERIADNASEIDWIKLNLRRLLSDEDYILDSINIASFASPEGPLSNNNYLCAMRAQSASNYFERFVERTRDSIRREEGMTITVGDDGESAMRATEKGSARIRFRSRSGGENWETLDELVRRDTVMTDADRDEYFALAELGVDERERAMFNKSWYKHLRNDVYPELRNVRFDFALHRKGMVKDTVHTTELDTVYMRGVQAIEDRDFETAINILRPYNDYNTAIAYVAMDRNESAMSILKNVPRTDQVKYMLAILYARNGDEQNAVQFYLECCRHDRMYVSRGNLDPEISALIKKYNLNAEPEDDWGDLGF